MVSGIIAVFAVGAVCNYLLMPRTLIFDLTQPNFYDVQKDGFVIMYEYPKLAPLLPKQYVIRSNRVNFKVDFRIEPSMEMICRTKSGDQKIYALDDPKAPDDNLDHYWISSRNDLNGSFAIPVSSGTKRKALQNMKDLDAKYNPKK